MDSNRGMTLWKVLALCSALGLGGGYVWQRQKAADPQVSKEPEAMPRTVLPGSKSAWGFSPDGKRLDGGRGGDDIVVPDIPKSDLQGDMGRDLNDFGSGGFVLPDDVPEEPVREKTVLPGSKSIAPLLEHPDRRPAEPEPPVKPGKVEP